MLALPSKTMLSNENLYDLFLRRTDVTTLLKGLAENCLRDKKRTLTLMDIISNTTREGDIGVDLGGASGILGIAFLNAGGEFLYSVERVDNYCVFIGQMARELGLSKRIEIARTDVTTFEPRKNIDYVIAELVYAGLVSEQLVEAAMNIRKYTSSSARYVPTTAISTITINDSIFPLSAEVEYDRAHLPTIDRMGVDAVVSIPIIRDGVPTLAVFNTELMHPNDQKTGQTETLCNPITFDLRELPSKPKYLKAGQTLNLRIQYGYGSMTSLLDSFVRVA